MTVPCRRLGFEPPTDDLHLRLLPVGDRWRLFLWRPDGLSGDLSSWLGEHVPAAVHRQVRENLSIYDLDTLPEPWRWWRSAPEITDLRLAGSGDADLFLRGQPDAVLAFAAGLGLDEDQVGPWAPEEALLTWQQHRAISIAVSEGFFEVPREIRLADLADRVGLSIGGLSELLRRAQGTLLEAYLAAHPAPGLSLPDAALAR